MTRFLVVAPALLCALALAVLRPALWAEALLGGGLGAGEALLAGALLPAAISGSHEGFLKAFGIVFASQAACFAALALLSWKGPFAGLPLLAVYAAGAVGGTLAVGLALKPKGVAGVR